MKHSPVVAALLCALTLSCGRAPDDSRAAPLATQGAASVTAYKVPIDGAPTLGDARAPVTLVAFSDYECPFCVRADALVTQLRKAYGPKLRIVMRQHPLPIHAHARAAAVAALAAHAQGKFWPMHERLFASSRSLDEESLVRLATEAGLELARWQADRAGAASALAREESLGENLAITGTPTFFVNGRRIAGAQPIDVFQKAIAEEIDKAEGLVAKGVLPEDVYATLQKDAEAKAPAPKAPPGAVAQAPVPGATAPAHALPAGAGPGCEGPDCGCKGEEPEEYPGRVENVPIGAAPVKGAMRAPVTVVVFGDFECPFCLRSEATLRALAEQYGTKVKIAWKHVPLPMHPSARAAAKAAYAAGEQGKFWEYHDALFAHQDALDPASLERYAKDLGLDVDRFRATTANSRTESAIASDEADAANLGVTGTPTFFVNGRRLAGAQPLHKFQAKVELALADGAR
jgi:protein-disulfide isomerase